ncbi:MAG TPA: PIN domain-containing protein [Flavobacteriaceae bacterium]|nr:PIN domain-containing protein [Flavobacteriaceae bacterium]
METIYLDTHVVVWLFAGEVNKISNKALDYIEKSELLISPMVVLELEFLHEIGRLNYTHDKILTSLEKSIDLKVCSSSFAIVVKESTKLNWTRDPFDRLIVANAQCNDNSILLSRDRKIGDNYEGTVW